MLVLLVCGSAAAVGAAPVALTAKASAENGTAATVDAAESAEAVEAVAGACRVVVGGDADH